MNDGKRRVVLFLLVLCAFVFHAAYSPDLRIGPARPDLTVTAMLVAAQFSGPNTGAALGFMAGLLEASYVSILIGSFLVTRTLAGYAVGSLEERIYRENVLVTVAIVGLGTLMVQSSFYVVAPQHHAAEYFRHALWQAAYNAVLAIPLFFLFRKAVGKKRFAAARA